MDSISYMHTSLVAECSTKNQP